MHRREPALDQLARHVRLSDHTDDRGMGFRPHPPDVEIGDSRIAGCLDQLANFVGDMVVSPVEQDGRCPASASTTNAR